MKELFIILGVLIYGLILSFGMLCEAANEDEKVEKIYERLEKRQNES